MTPFLGDRGYTLVELILAVFITSIIALVAALSFSSFSRYLHNVSLRQAATSDADRSIAMMIATLQKAKSSSVTICSCGGVACGTSNACTLSAPAGTPPNSRIEFVTTDNRNLSAIYWDSGTAYLRLGTGNPQKLADNVTGLLFTGDGTDFSHIRITLRLDVPLSPNAYATVLLPNQVAVLVQ